MRDLGMKSCVVLIAGLWAWPLHAAEAPDWNGHSSPEVVISVAEPAPNEVVVVVNDNAPGGNHAGLFAGSLLIDPAGSYFGVRRQDKAWRGPTLADYVRYQTVDGTKIRLYRFRLPPQTFDAIVQRIRDAGPTPPLFCASAVQNLLAEIPPFDAVKR
ncbi:MAG TPA: hypothetical protein VF501_05160, partial [Thiobacillus sp.]